MRQIPIFIAVVSHKHGKNLYTAVTEDGAKDGIASYCSENWNQIIEGPDNDDDSPLHDAGDYAKLHGRDAMIEKYFEADAAFGGSEYADIIQDVLELEDDPIDVETRRHVVHLVGLLQELVNDIEAMKAPNENWFGEFSSYCSGYGDTVNIEWPNLAISLAKAKAYLEPKQEQTNDPK